MSPKQTKKNNNASPWSKYSMIIHFGPSLRELKEQTSHMRLRLQVCGGLQRVEEQRL